MTNLYHTSKPPKCTRCDKGAVRMTINGRNKGWYRTCGSDECKNRQYKLTDVSKSKCFKGQKECIKCKSFYVANSAAQKWGKVCVPDKAARCRIIRYGLSQPEFDIQKVKQNNKCAVCHINPPVFVDHCHITGRLRSLLCAGCNTAVGYIESYPWMNEAREYVTGKIAGSNWFHNDSH